MANIKEKERESLHSIKYGELKRSVHSTRKIKNVPTILRKKLKQSQRIKKYSKQNKVKKKLINKKQCLHCAGKGKNVSVAERKPEKVGIGGIQEKKSEKKIEILFDREGDDKKHDQMISKIDLNSGILVEKMAKLKKCKKRKTKILGHSRRALILPKSSDPELRLLRRKDNYVRKLINYLKRGWNVNIGEKPSETQISFRTLHSMEHTKTEDSWMENRMRQKVAECTGLYSNIREKYKDLESPELDAALLVFKNMPSELQINSAHWIRRRLLREERLKKKREALPRLPRKKIFKPNYHKGKLNTSVGGSSEIDKIVKEAEILVKRVLGSGNYINILKEWRDIRENEELNRSSPFGLIKKEQSHFANQTLLEEKGEKAPAENKNQNHEKDHHQDKQVIHHPHPHHHQKPSMKTDERAAQRDFLHFEHVLSAISDILMSLLNIKTNSLNYLVPLHLKTVGHLRENPHIDEHKIVAEKPRFIDESYKFVPFASKKMNYPAIKKAKEILRQRQRNREIKSPLKIENEDQKVSIEVFEREKAQIPIECLDLKFDRNTDIEAEIQKKLKELDLEKDFSQIGSISISKHLDPESDIKSANQTLHRKESESESIKTAASTIYTEKVFVEKNYQDDLSKKLERHFITYSKTFELIREFSDPPWKILKKTDRIENIINSQKASKIYRPMMEERIKRQELLAGENNENSELADKPENIDKKHQLKMKKFSSVAEIPLPKNYGNPNNGRKINEKLGQNKNSNENILKRYPDVAKNTRQSSAVRRLMKKAGVVTSEKVMFEHLSRNKKAFRMLENKLKFHWTNEREKFEANMMKRFYTKFSAIQPTGIFEDTVENMRRASKSRKPGSQIRTGNGAKMAGKLGKGIKTENSVLVKSTKWYYVLEERFETIGASRHYGCRIMMQKIHKLSHFDTSSRKNLIPKLCLLVQSLPTTELGTRHWQEGVMFVLHNVLGCPAEFFYLWLHDRSLPVLI